MITINQKNTDDFEILQKAVNGLLHVVVQEVEPYTKNYPDLQVELKIVFGYVYVITKQMDNTKHNYYERKELFFDNNTDMTEFKEQIIQTIKDELTKAQNKLY